MDTKPGRLRISFSRCWTNPNSYTHAKCDANGNTYGYANSDTYSYANCDTHSYPNTQSYAEASSDASPSAHPAVAILAGTRMLLREFPHKHGRSKS